MFLSELKIWNFRKDGSGDGGTPGLYLKLNKEWVDEARYYYDGFGLKETSDIRFKYPLVGCCGPNTL